MDENMPNTNEQKPVTKKKYRADVIVIASLLLLSILRLLVSDLTKKDGAYVEVEENGVVVGTYPLAVDSTYTLGGGSNILTVKGGTAYMSYSSCPDHICENTGKVKHVGQTIVCLPNRLTVTVVGDSDNSVDFVS